MSGSGRSLFALGLFLTAFPFGLVSTHSFALDSMRIPGVLQRIAICNLAASAIVLRTEWRDQVKWVVGLLLFVGVAARIPVASHGSGVLDRGQRAGLDRLGRAGRPHWTGAPAPGFVPGLLSTLPAMPPHSWDAWPDTLLREPMGDWSKAFYLVAAGVVALFVGAILVRWMPINRTSGPPPSPSLWQAGRRSSMPVFTG
jgi:predicted acyltransferase